MNILPQSEHESWMLLAGVAIGRLMQIWRDAFNRSDWPNRLRDAVDDWRTK